MKADRAIRYSMQLAMLNQLYAKKMITEEEYKKIEIQLMKDYGVVSNLTA